MDKKIIITILVFFFAASAYLFFVSGMKSDALRNQDQWILSFTDPKGDSLDFAIENLSGKNNFHWEISADAKKADAGNINITRGSIWTRSVQINDYAGKKVTIIVSDGENKKQIYKNSPY